MRAAQQVVSLQQKIIHCEKCPRLRTHCKKIAREKRRQFAGETYWGKPVPGFGDLNAEVLVVGLAPAAHGANRTGRMFTGDQSGVWLYRALEKAGFGNGLKLKKAYITAVARCAPPENKPTLAEIAACSEYLAAELMLLKKVTTIICLGKIALDGLWKVLDEQVKPTRAVPKFKHGLVVKLKNNQILICSYHPSQQNTFTKRLTEPMFDQVFDQIFSLKQF